MQALAFGAHEAAGLAQTWRKGGGSNEQRSMHYVNTRPNIDRDSDSLVRVGAALARRPARRFSMNAA